MPLTQDDKLKYKDLYLQTAREYVKALRENILLLEKEQSAEAVEVIHRSAHSLKSQSAMMNYGHIATLSLAIEDVYAQYKDSPETVDQTVIEVAAQAVEALSDAIEAIANNNETDLSKNTQLLRVFVIHKH